jgi:hypothetical protein
MADAVAASMDCEPASASSDPSGVVTDSGNVTSIGPTPARADARSDSLNAATSSMLTPRRAGISSASDSGPNNPTVSSSGRGSVPMPPDTSALTGTGTIVPPVPGSSPSSVGRTDMTASEASAPLASRTAIAPVGVTGNCTSGMSLPWTWPSFVL